jgi:hypothetical protein
MAKGNSTIAAMPEAGSRAAHLEGFRLWCPTNATSVLAEWNTLLLLHHISKV